jgi:hypothetical protein
MTDIHGTTTRWSWILAFAAPLALGCESAQPVATLLAPPSEPAAVRAKLSEAALFVGNFSPPPGLTTNGVLRYDGTGAFIDNMVPEGTAGLTIACCMTFGPDENLYVGSPLTGNVLKYHGVTGKFIKEFIPAGSGGLVVPLTLVFHGGKVYVGDPGSNAIRRYDARTGAPLDLNAFVPPGSGGLTGFSPQLFAFGPGNDLYVASVETNEVLRYDGVTGTFEGAFVKAGPDGVIGPSGLTFGPDGNLYVGNGQGVNRYNGRTGALIDLFVRQGSGGLDTPVGMVFGPDDNFYVASAGSGEILRYDGRTGRHPETFVPLGRGGISGPRNIEFKTTITVCHQPQGNNARGDGKSITIGYLSARSHVAHGDALGPC